MPHPPNPPCRPVRVIMQADDAGIASMATPW